MKKIISAFLLSTVVLLSFNSKAQLSGDNDSTFNPGDVGFGNGDGTYLSVYSTVAQPDGKIIIAGQFAYYNGDVTNIVRIDPDGNLDTTFNSGTGANYNLYSVGLQNDGKIIAAGGFNNFNGTAINRIVRLNTDGSLDPSFNPTSTTIWSGASILSAAIQSDGKILIGGNFTAYNGTTRNRI